MSEYLRKRFEERIWESDFSTYLEQFSEESAERMVTYLVEGLLIEVGE